MAGPAPTISAVPQGMASKLDFGEITISAAAVASGPNAIQQRGSPNPLYPSLNGGP